MPRISAIKSDFRVGFYSKSRIIEAIIVLRAWGHVGTKSIFTHFHPKATPMKIRISALCDRRPWFSSFRRRFSPRNASIRRSPSKRFREISGQIQHSAKLGVLHVEWKDDGKAFEFAQDGKKYRFDIATGEKKEIDPKSPPADALKNDVLRSSRRSQASPAQMPPPRAQQFKTALSPDKKFMAVCLDRNLWLFNLENHHEFAVTSDGSEQSRIHYASANWTYGEELDQGTAMWWSPNGRKIAFYRFDENSGESILPRAGSNENPRPPERRAVQQGRHAESGSRFVDLRSRHAANRQGRCPRRQTVRQFRRGPLSLRHFLDQGRRGVAFPSHQPAAEYHGVLRRQSGDPARAASSSARSGRQVGRRIRRPFVFSRTGNALSGPRNATAGRIFISTN